MEPLRGSITAVGKGEVSVRLHNGMKMSYKTDRGFKYGEMVLVLFDYTTLKISGMMYPEELEKEDEAAPKCAPRKYCGVEEHPIDEEGSFPLPDGRSEEFFLEGEV